MTKRAREREIKKELSIDKKKISMEILMEKNKFIPKT